jgi:hypothetical protein
MSILVQHMTPIGGILKVKKGVQSAEKIMNASGGGMVVKNTGTSNLKIDGRDVELQNVLHVPDLAANLLSVSQIVESGNSVVFDKNGCVIRDKANNIITRCEQSNGVYKFSSVQFSLLIYRCQVFQILQKNYIL